MEPNKESPQPNDEVPATPRPRRNRKPLIIAAIAIVALILVGLGPKLAQGRKLHQDSVDPSARRP